MYERHFGFKVKPFSLTPDPAFLFASRQHVKAMTMLEYGLEAQAAFCLLTGDIGSGKNLRSIALPQYSKRRCKDDPYRGAARVS